MKFGPDADQQNGNNLDPKDQTAMFTVVDNISIGASATQSASSDTTFLQPSPEMSVGPALTFAGERKCNHTRSL